MPPRLRLQLTTQLSPVLASALPLGCQDDHLQLQNYAHSTGLATQLEKKNENSLFNSSNKTPESLIGLDLRPYQCQLLFSDWQSCVLHLEPRDRPDPTRIQSEKREGHGPPKGKSICSHLRRENACWAVQVH